MLHTLPHNPLFLSHSYKTHSVTIDQVNGSRVLIIYSQFCLTFVRDLLLYVLDLCCVVFANN